MIKLVGIGVLKFFFQPGKCGSAGQVGGHNRRADLVSFIVEGEIINTLVPVGFATTTAGFGSDIIPTEDGVVFVKIGEMIVFVDATDDSVHGFGNGKVIAWSDSLDLIGARNWRVF